MAVATNGGDVTIRKVDLAALGDGDSDILSGVFKKLKTGNKTKEWIEVLVFSPNDKYLAIGSHDNNIYVYDTQNYSKCQQYKRHSSFVTAIDFDLDSKYMRSVCGAYELIFFNLKTNK